MSEFNVGDVVRITRAINGVDDKYVGDQQVIVSTCTGFGGMPIATERCYLSLDQIELVKSALESPTRTANADIPSGGLNSYYLAFVEHPQREDQPSYTAECEDIIQALDLTFDEGCIFKEIWRSANARLGNGKIGHKQLYGAEKINHYAKRILKQAKQSK